MKTTRFFVTGLATVALAATCTPSGAEPDFKVGFGTVANRVAG